MKTLLTSCSVFVLCGSLMVSAYDTTGFITLSDGGSYESSPLKYPGHWNLNGVPLEEFVANGRYVVPKGKELYCPDAGGVYFRCGALAVNGRMRMKNYGDNDSNAIKIEQLDLLDGAILNTQSGQGSLAGATCVYAGSQTPAQIVQGVGSTVAAAQWHFTDWVLSGARDSALTMKLGHDDGTQFNFKWISGDGSAFLGTLTVECPETVTSPDALISFTPTDIMIGGTLKMSRRTRIVLDGTGGLTVGTLELADGVILGGLNGTRLLSVTNALSLAGNLVVDLASFSLPQSYAESAKLNILHCDAAVDVSDIDLMKIRFLNPASRAGDYGVLEWETVSDGKMLVLKLPPIVQRTSVEHNETIADYRSEFDYAASPSGDFYWDDSNLPDVEHATGKIYLSRYKTLAAPHRPDDADIYSFPGERIVLERGLANIFLASAQVCRGMYIKDLFLKNGAGVRVYNYGGREDSRYPRPEGGNFTVFRLAGGITLFSGTASFECYGANKLISVEGELRGTGDVRLQIYPSGSANNIAAAAEIVGRTDRWSGKLEIAGFGNNTSGGVALDGDGYGTYSSGETVPNANCRSRFFLSDAENLGGVRETFAPDALKVSHYGEIVLRRSVTLNDDRNRGVSFGDHSTLTVTNGLTFAINRPLTWDGVVSKKGAGMLTLGAATLKFGDEQSDMPTSGKNVLEIDGGALRVTSAAAADGLSIRLSSTAKLVAGIGDDAAHALRLVKEGSAIVADGSLGVIPVEFAVSGEPRKFQSVLCVSRHANLQFKCANPWPRYNCEVAALTENGKTTYVARVFRAGLALIFR